MNLAACTRTRASAVVARAPGEAVLFERVVDPAPILAVEMGARGSGRLVEGEERRRVEGKNDAAERLARGAIGGHTEKRSAAANVASPENVQHSSLVRT